MIIVITGPTAVGKTKLSVELAKRLNGEIINADSTQVYKGLDIATAKITEEEKEGIIHHLFDIKSVEEDYSIYEYQKDAREKIDDIIKREKTPILVGGTGLYIKSVLYDYEFNEEKKYDYSSYSNDELYEKLLKVDPKTEIHRNNRKRVERALSYYENHKEPMSNKEVSNKLLYDAIFIGLTTNREVLYEKINTRVDKMVNEGLIEEAKKIFDLNIKSKAVMTPIGYKELFPYFEHNKKLEECIDEIKQKSRRYAKRQYTWFNNKMDINWFNVNFDNFEKTIKEVLEYIKNNS